MQRMQRQIRARCCTGTASKPDRAAAALAANESQLQDMLRLSCVSMASSGVGSCEEVDPEFMCPICMVRKHACLP